MLPRLRSHRFPMRSCVMPRYSRHDAPSHPYRAGVAWVLSAIVALSASQATAQELPSTEPVPRLVAQVGHDRVESVTLSTDGQLLATASRDETVKVWATDGYRLLRTFLLTSQSSDPHRPIVRFVPSTHRVVGMASDSVLVWDVATGAQVLALRSENVQAIAVSPDGQWIAGSSLTRNELYTKATMEIAVWDAHSGEERIRIDADSAYINEIAFHPSKPLLAASTGEGPVHVWSTETGEHLRAFVGPEGATARISFDNDGDRLAASATDRSAWVWEVDTGEVVQHFPDVYGGSFSAGYDMHILLSNDGQTLITSNETQGECFSVWSLDSRERQSSLCVPQVQAFARQQSFVRTSYATLDELRFFRRAGSSMIVFSSNDVVTLIDGSASNIHALPRAMTTVERAAACETDEGSWLSLAPQFGSVAMLWDLTAGRPIQRVNLDTEHGTYSYSPDCETLATAAVDDVFLRDVAADSVRSRFQGYPPPELLPWMRYQDVTYSPDGAWIATAGGETEGNATEVVIRDATTGEVRLAWDAEEPPQQVRWLRFSPDARVVATIGSDNQEGATTGLHLWDATSGARLRTLEYARHLGVDQQPASFSADGQRIAGETSLLRRNRRPGGITVWDVESGAEVYTVEGDTPVRFSPDGRWLVTGGPNASLRVWEADTGALHAELEGHTNVVTSVDFVASGHFLASSSWDNSVRFWELQTGQERARVLTNDESWLVVAPDGRFDAPDLERIAEAVWVAPDDPLYPLAIEAFMADYYEPRLLARILEGERFPPIADLLDRNRVQPVVRISRVDFAPDGTASFSVVVEGQARTYRGARHESGAYDLRVFRDGQLIDWRDGRLVTGTDSVRVRFEGVPIASGADSVTVSAYAFNEERIKSATATVRAAVPLRKAAPPPRRAIVVSFGVDRFDDPAWNLGYAVADAEAYQQALPDALASTDTYDEIIRVALTSSDEAARSTNATAAALRGVLALLAGTELDAEAREARASIPGAERLTKATPDDVVLLTVSTHGYTDDQGTFFLFPSDLPASSEASRAGGGRTLGPTVLDAAVSSEELTDWLRPLDAGDITVVIDACHAAAAVEGSAFKPGPLGSRGLGQLAYSKGMRILSATQAADVALETDQLGLGLLTYALVSNGLRSGLADGAQVRSSPDGRITLTEWLQYGVRRVPDLHEALRSGDPSAIELGRSGSLTGTPTAKYLQTPSLFDYGRRVDPVLARPMVD
ncbi:MAG: hypothetical protein AAGF99_02340 [Bacteroidota bacterium]